MPCSLDSQHFITPHLPVKYDRPKAWKQIYPFKYHFQIGKYGTWPPRTAHRAFSDSFLNTFPDSNTSLQLQIKFSATLMYSRFLVRSASLRLRSNPTVPIFKQRRSFKMSNTTFSNTIPEESSSSNATTKKETLALPEVPFNNTTQLDMSNGNTTIKLDHLGPMVVNVDGSLGRITNWLEMTEMEQKNTLRVVGKRNQARLAAVRVKEGLDDKKWRHAWFKDVQHSGSLVDVLLDFVKKKCRNNELRMASIFPGAAICVPTLNAMAPSKIDTWRELDSLWPMAQPDGTFVFARIHLVMTSGWMLLSFTMDLQFVCDMAPRSSIKLLYKHRFLQACSLWNAVKFEELECWYFMLSMPISATWIREFSTLKILSLSLHAISIIWNRQCCRSYFCLGLFRIPIPPITIIRRLVIWCMELFCFEFPFYCNSV